MKKRIPPAEAKQWSDETRAILAAATPAASSPDGKGPPNILYTIAHHPTLLQPFLGFTATLAMRGVLPRRDSELLALRAAWNCQSPFEWGHHVEYALAEGLSDEEVERIAEGPEHPQWRPGDRLLLTAADELHARQQLSDETFAGLRDAWSDAQIVEITFVVGNYTMLSMVANATGVPLEERVPAMPSKVP
ncbi:MAG: carboxymuconolactone decarboxylase family protein [Deltaproteobacteria bacterium]|nr:carboxymuconolactone decarboxylase family protein [Deltaproteobacteria bacterium]MBW2417223.1 carboxymuconolactone decarboxylase family protein [Deltaproteobacteria bacterium]